MVWSGGGGGDVMLLEDGWSWAINYITIPSLCCYYVSVQVVHRYVCNDERYVTPLVRVHCYVYNVWCVCVFVCGTGSESSVQFSV